MKYWIVTLFASLVLTAVSSVLFAQAPKPSIAGTVSDPAHAKLPDGAVVVTPEDPKAKPYAAIPNESGAYAFYGLPAGTYVLTGRFPGFNAESFKVEVKPETMVEKNLTLSAIPGAIVVTYRDTFFGPDSGPSVPSPLPNK
jgi:hypothetical protein